MRTAARASTGFLWRHPWQLAMAVMGVCAGVAVIVAVDLANESSRLAFLESLDAVTGDASHQIVGGPGGIDETLYTALRTENGIDAAAPVIEADLRLGERTLNLLGVDLFAEGTLRSYEFSADPGPDSGDSVFRRFLLEPGSIVLSERTARELSLETGDALEVSVNGRRQSASLVATFVDEGRLGAFLLTDIATAQEWLRMPGRISRIDLKLDAAASDALRQELPPDTKLLNAAGRTRATLEMSDAFMVNLKAMSLLALLVGLFLIYNSASFTVLQRRRMFGVLRALGVTRRQVFALIMSEALVLGAVAGVLGVALGIWLGEQLLFFVTRSINDLYFRVAVTDVAVSNATLAKGLAAGLLASLAAAAVPALEAAANPPRLSMLRSTLERRAGALIPAMAAAGVLILLLAAATLALSETSLTAGLTAVFLLILGTALLIPWFVVRTTALLAPLADRIGGVAARLAVAGIGTSLSRTGVAIIALAVAVSASIGVSVMVDSFRGSVSQWLDRTLQADIYVGLPDGGLDAGLVAAAVALDEVVAYSTARRILLVSGERQTRLNALKMAPDAYGGTEILDANPRDVWPRWETQDAVLVSEPYAWRYGLAAGDDLSLATDQGERVFRVLAVYQSYDLNGSGVMLSRQTYDRHWRDAGIDSIGLYLTDERAAAATIQRIEQLGTDFGQQVFVSSNVDIRALSLSIFDRTFVITDILYWLAIGVAVIGILGAMLALQLERSRELGLLRALGMTPRQLAGSITLQTATAGLMSGLASIPLGIAMAWVLIDVINRRAFGWKIAIDIDPGYIAAGLMLALGAAVAAGLYPAWRAGTSEPALAMREE
ncbi:MAG: FtsX-like permease family protein [Pseudomonadota bacterium]